MLGANLPIGKVKNEVVGVWRVSTFTMGIICHILEEIASGLKEPDTREPARKGRVEGWAYSDVWNRHKKLFYGRIESSIMHDNFVTLRDKTLTLKEKVVIHDFLLGEPIKTVTAGFIKAESNKKAKKKTLAWIETTGDKIIYREDIGEVVFDRAGVKTSFEHRIYQNKLDALPAIPDVIEKGKIIDISNDFDGKPIKNTLIAAPIQIGEKPEILVVRLRMIKGHNNKFYVHDIFIADKMLKNKGNTIKAGSAGKPVGGPSKSIAHIVTILHDILTVKG